MPRSTYYERLQALKRPDKYQKVKQQISIIFQASKKNYGYRRMHCELVKRGFNYCSETVRHLMTALGLKVTVYSNRNRSYYHS
ncbi:IS3 family transposase [Limosilactobacillus reuteri]|uniref:IS3 family transposase n=1 Tax=Limosilactobacillus reuteri TaxID=1598 RepID=UPI003A8F7FA8